MVEYKQLKKLIFEFLKKKNKDNNINLDTKNLYNTVEYLNKFSIKKFDTIKNCYKRLKYEDNLNVTTTTVFNTYDTRDSGHKCVSKKTIMVFNYRNIFVDPHYEFINLKHVKISDVNIIFNITIKANNNILFSENSIIEKDSSIVKINYMPIPVSFAIYTYFDIEITIYNFIKDIKITFVSDYYILSTNLINKSAKCEFITYNIDNNKCLISHYSAGTTSNYIYIIA